MLADAHAVLKQERECLATITTASTRELPLKYGSTLAVSYHLCIPIVVLRRINISNGNELLVWRFMQFALPFHL